MTDVDDDATVGENLEIVFVNTGNSGEFLTLLQQLELYILM